LERASRIAIARALLDLLDGKTTTRAETGIELDAERYVDPERFAHERRRLFLEFPQVVGLSCDLPEPGSWSCLDVAGVAVLLVRGEDGAFRAFINGCRHRGARVAEGCGRGTRFVCPWHSWTYDDHGRLVGLPDRSSFESLRLEQRSLTPLPAHERYGLLLVLPTPGRSFDPEDVLRGIGPQIESFGLGSLYRVDTREMRVAANWKLAVDTGMEVYHVAFLHKDTVGPRNIGNTQTFETFGLHQRMAIPAPSILSLRDLPEREWGDPMRHFQLVHNLFPSTGLVIASELVALTRAEPGSHVGETLFRFSTYSWQRPVTEQDQSLARLGFDGLYHVVSNEDFRVAAQAQKSFEAERARSVLVGRNEIGLQALHRSYDALLGS
jgi:phenylpropionate dioxygenase-like ring-hydroxylating dioxygenase large terminal subunit